MTLSFILLAACLQNIGPHRVTDCCVLIDLGDMMLSANAFFVVVVVWFLSFIYADWQMRKTIFDK